MAFFRGDNEAYESDITLQKHQQLPIACETHNFENTCMEKQPCIYIMTNKYRGTLYIGVTSNLVKRVWQHRNHVVKGFTYKYGLQHLVYYELYADMENAICREKAMKKRYRAWKIELIETKNPDWDDLYDNGSIF
jgi:putative endonuclease